VIEEIRNSGTLEVPLHLRNPVTKLMEGLGYGKGYLYPHDHPDKPQEYLPLELRGRHFIELPDKGIGSEEKGE
jgi:putative ATPase